MVSCDKSVKPRHESEAKPEKVGTGKKFVIRDSHYTTLLKNDQIRSVYHICVVIFILILLDSVTHDFLTSGRIYLGLRTIKQGFGKFHIGLAIWTLMNIPVLGVYYALRIWAQVYQDLEKNTNLRSLWNYSCILVFAGIQLILLYIGTQSCLTCNFPVATSCALLMETLRLIMKTYAYVRINVPQLLTEKSFQLDPVSSYVYYLFAPTFLYRASYPRTNKIQWTFALRNLFELVLIVFLSSFIYERYILANFQDFGVERVKPGQLFDRVFAMVLPSSMLLLGAGYLILQNWCNFTGEVLRFGDRMFYKDWWTAPDYKTYYRTWNIVVHEWLLEFIYKDGLKYVFNGSKVCSTLSVFYVSAVMHEYVVGLSLRMYYPVLFIFFAGFGVIFHYTTDKLPLIIGKVFFWFTLLLGGTMITCLYAMEYFARKNSGAPSSLRWMPVSSVSYVLVGS